MAGKKQSHHSRTTDADVFPTCSCDDFTESMASSRIGLERFNKQATRLWIEDYPDRRPLKRKNILISAQKKQGITNE